MISQPSSLRVSKTVLIGFAAAAFLVSGFFVLSAQADVSLVNVTSPDGGEVWNGTHPVTWTAAGDAGDTVSILWSTNNFITSATLIAGVPFDAGSYDWDTTLLPDGTDYKIRVQGISGDFDTSFVIFELDNTAPTIDSVTTYDGDSDGNVDTATVVFSEAVLDSSFSASAFSIDGQLGTLIVSGVLDDNTFDVLFSSVIGTEQKTLEYVPGTGHDLADPGNPLEAASVLTGDAAAPVFLSAKTTSTTTLDLTFSEDLDGGTVNSIGDEFTVVGHTVSGASETSPGVVTLTLSTTMGTEETPNVTFTNIDDFKDLANNEAVSPITLAAADGVAPILSEVTPVTTPTSDNTPDYTFSTSEDGSIDYAGGCTSATTVATTVNNTITFNTLADGLYDSCTITVTDSSSNISIPLAIADFLVDVTAPAVDAGTDKIVNATVLQDATATDGGSGIASYLWTKESGPGLVTFGSDSTEDTTLTADADGIYVIRLTVTDNAGNSAFDEMTLVWDTVAPILTEIVAVTTPTNDNTPNYTFSADEAGTISYGGSCSGVTTSADVGPNPIDFGPLADGPYDLCTITVTDAASNASTPLAVTAFFVDTVQPSVDAGSDKEVNATVSQDATVIDPAPSSGIATYAWTQISGPGTVLFSSNSTEDTDLTADVDGTYVLRLTVTDFAGNSDFDEMTLIWDTVNPEHLTSFPSDGTTGVSVAADTATVTFDEDIVLLDASRVLLVNDSTDASHKGTVEVSGGDGNSAVLNISYSGLAHGTKYRINVKANAVQDVAGNNYQDSFVSYFTTEVDVTPPVVDSFSVGSITETSATLSVVTNENATCRYASTDSSFVSMAEMDVTGGTVHSQDVTGLSALTGYDYYVRCEDASSNVMTTSAHVSFTTSAPAADLTAPAVPVITTGSATIDADTYTIAGTAADDGGVRTVRLYNGATLVGTLSLATGETAWAFTVSLIQEADNVFTATSADVVGNVSVASAPTTITEATTIGDEDAPPAPDITTADDTVDADTYEITGTAGPDIPSDGTRIITVYRNGIVVGSFSLLAGDEDWSFVAALEQNEDNFFTAYATDVAGNESDESNEVVITEEDAAPAPDTTAPILTDIQTINISSVSATITWTTDEPATSQVEYGPTSAYGFSTSEDLTLEMSHSADLPGLIPGLTYHFRVKSADAGSNLTTSDDQTFATAPAASPPAVPGVTLITAVKTSASPDDSYPNGWEWVFDVTLPTNEASVSMKFADWTGTAGTISTAGNVRFFSAQSSDVNSEGTAVTIDAAGEYSGPMTLTGDLDLSEVGRQIRITVQVKVPVGTPGGSYSTSYGIRSTDL